jgi:outer membrane protein assembly factor BamB
LFGIMFHRYAVVAGGAFTLLVIGFTTMKLARRPKSGQAGTAALASEAKGDGGQARAPDGKVSSGPPSMLHLDPRHTNRSPFVGPRAPKLLWTFDTGGPIQAAPIVLDNDTIVVASLGGKLYGLSDTGELRYQVDLGDRVYATPLAQSDALFVGSDAHKFFGLTKEGTIRFRLDADNDVDTGAVPAPWGGIVFASGRVVYASKPDGTLFWRLKTKRKCFSSPAVADDGTVYVGSQDHHVYAITPEGKVKWSLDLGADVDSSPAIQDDGTVIVGSDKSEIVAVAPEDGSIRWRTDVGGYVRGALSIARDGTILSGTYGPTPHMVGLDPVDGRLRFRFSIRGTGAPEFGIHGGPVEDAEGRLYFGAQDDHAYALTSDGAIIWKFKTGGDVDAPVVITPRGTLLVGSDDGKLYAIGQP